MENSTLLGKTSAGSKACEVLGMPLDAKKEEGPAVVLTFLGIELDAQVGGQAAEGTAERAQEEAVGMERHEEVPQEGPLVHHWPVEPCLQSGAGWTIVPEETVGLEHDCVQDGLVVAAECVSQSRHRVVVEIRCPVERREHDEGRCGGRRATSGAHNRRLRLLGLRSSVQTKVVPPGLGEGCSSQGVEHHAQRIAAHSSGCGSVGKAMEEPHCEGEMRQHGRGGDHKVWLVQGSTCHATEEMPGISRGV